MITNIIEDMDGRIISKQSYISAYNSYDFSPEVKIKKENHDFLDEFDFLLGMLIPDESRNDFIISYLNKELKKYYSFSTENAVGSYLFKSMEFLDELNIRDMLFDSFNNDRPLEFKVHRYIEDILVSADIYKFFRFKDKLYFQLDKSNDLDILNKSSHETIENSKVSVGIIQNNKWVYGNRTFCRINGIKASEIDTLPLFNANIYKRENVSLSELKYILSDILNRKQFFFQDNVELSRDGETYYIRELIYPTSFNNKPAIEVIFLDLTEEKKIEREFDDLNRKLEAILKLGRLAVCKVENGRIYWSREIFSILGIAPEKLNLRESVDTIEDFFHIIDEFLLKTDMVSSGKKNHDLHKYLTPQFNKNETSNLSANVHGSANLKLTNINLDSLDFALSPNSSKRDSPIDNQKSGFTSPRAGLDNQKSSLKNPSSDLTYQNASLNLSSDINQDTNPKPNTDLRIQDQIKISPNTDLKNQETNANPEEYQDRNSSPDNLKNQETNANPEYPNKDLSPDNLKNQETNANPEYPEKDLSPDNLKNQDKDLNPDTDLKNQDKDLNPDADLKSRQSSLKADADLKNQNPDLLEYPKASSVDSEFEKLFLNNYISIDSTPTKSYKNYSNSESSVELDYLNIYDRINNGNGNLDFSNLYDEISKQKSQSDNINVKFAVKTKNNNIRIINCDFIIYDENPLNLTGYAQDITYDESLNSEFKQQLSKYKKLYKELHESKTNLESELEMKYRLLEETYFNINHNLELFMYLLSSYLSDNHENLDNYYRIIQKRIEILFFNSKMHQKLETHDKIEFKEFISNIVFYAFRDILKNADIEIHVNEGIFINRNEIDLLYLILCEFLLNSIDLNENDFVRLKLKAYEYNGYIYLDITGDMMNKVDMDCLDLLKFVKRFKTTRLKDITINDKDKTVQMLVKLTK